jgi:hypothetical protein
MIVLGLIRCKSKSIAALATVVKYKSKATYWQDASSSKLQFTTHHKLFSQLFEKKGS